MYLFLFRRKAAVSEFVFEHDVRNLFRQQLSSSKVQRKLFVASSHLCEHTYCYINTTICTAQVFNQYSRAFLPRQFSAYKIMIGQQSDLN